MKTFKPIKFKFPFKPIYKDGCIDFQLSDETVYRSIPYDNGCRIVWWPCENPAISSEYVNNIDNGDEEQICNIIYEHWKYNKHRFYRYDKRSKTINI